MAHVETNVAIDSFQGKFKRNDRIVYRTRNGRTHAYAFDHPFRGTASEEQAQTRSTFGMAVNPQRSRTESRLGAPLCLLPQALPRLLFRPLLLHPPRLHHCHPQCRTERRIMKKCKLICIYEKFFVPLRPEKVFEQDNYCSNVSRG